MELAPRLQIKLHQNIKLINVDARTYSLHTTIQHSSYQNSPLYFIRYLCVKTIAYTFIKNIHSISVRARAMTKKKKAIRTGIARCVIDLSRNENFIPRSREKTHRGSTRLCICPRLRMYMYIYKEPYITVSLAGLAAR